MKRKHKMVITDPQTLTKVLELAKQAGRAEQFTGLPMPAPGDTFKDASTGVEYIYAARTVESNLQHEGWEVFTG